MVAAQEMVQLVQRRDKHARDKLVAQKRKLKNVTRELAFQAKHRRRTINGLKLERAMLQGRIKQLEGILDELRRQDAFFRKHLRVEDLLAVGLEWPLYPALSRR